MNALRDPRAHPITAKKCGKRRFGKAERRPAAKPPSGRTAKRRQSIREQNGKALKRYGKAARKSGARQTGETVNRQQRTANGERTAYISRFRRRAAPPDMSAVTNPGTNPPQCAPKCRFPRGGDPIPVGFSKNQKSPAHRTRTVFRCRTVFCLTLRTLFTRCAGVFLLRLISAARSDFTSDILFQS